MSHHHIIRNGFLDRKQWTFSFKKQCYLGAKMLKFRVSKPVLKDLRHVRVDGSLSLRKLFSLPI